MVASFRRHTMLANIPFYDLFELFLHISVGLPRPLWLPFELKNWATYVNISAGCGYTNVTCPWLAKNANSINIFSGLLILLFSKFQKWQIWGADLASTGRFWCHFRFSGFPKTFGRPFSPKRLPKRSALLSGSDPCADPLFLKPWHLLWLWAVFPFFLQSHFVDGIC